MSEMIEVTCKEFLDGGVDHLWILGNLGAHKADIESSVYQYGLYPEDGIIQIANGLFTEPGGEVMNMFNEPLDLKGELDNPQRAFNLSDTNASLVDYEADPRVMLTDFPYTICSADHIATLHKKKRDNFKASLKGETDVVLLHTTMDDPEWFAIVSDRYLAHNPDYDPKWYPMALGRLDKPPIVLIARRVSDNVPIATVALVESAIVPNTWLCYVFFSIEPCIRKVHLLLTQTILHPGSLLHYGASFSFDPERRKVFIYKNTLANASVRSPSVAIVRPETTRPYYDLNAGMWLL